MSKLESIFLNEPLEKPYNLPLCELTAVPSALPTPNHRSEASNQAGGVRGTPASPPPAVLPSDQMRTKEFSCQKLSEPRERRGTTPYPLSSAITRRQHLGRLLEVVHHLP